MNTKEIAEDLEAWAAATVDGLNAFPHEPPNYSEAFPLVACKILTDEETERPNDFSEQGYEQVHIQVLEIELNILVDPEPEWTSDQQLYDIVDSLKAALKVDPTLGQRVEMTSALYRVTYEGEVETADGTRANLGVFRIVIGQKVEA